MEKKPEELIDTNYSDSQAKVSSDAATPMEAFLVCESFHLYDELSPSQNHLTERTCPDGNRNLPYNQSQSFNLY